MLKTAYLTSDCGTIELKASEKGLRSVQFVSGLPSDRMEAPAFMEPYLAQFQEYFEGVRRQFRIPIDWSDIPPFHMDVLKMVYTIPYGRTRSYKQIAQVLGKPGAARAVGQANGKNRLAIIVPCHRVIGAKGELTGYAHGVEIKQRLLELEAPGCYARQSSLFALV